MPFSDLGVKTPEKGETWLGGFFRQGGPAGSSGWLYAGAQFYQSEKNFGELVFSGK